MGLGAPIVEGTGNFGGRMALMVMFYTLFGPAHLTLFLRLLSLTVCESYLNLAYKKLTEVRTVITCVLMHFHCAVTKEMPTAL